MNVIFTCGGTGGHINPAIALANTLRRRDPNVKILFVGCVGEMEEQLVPRRALRSNVCPVPGFSGSSISKTSSAMSRVWAGSSPP